jgi:hypothetical protein
MKKVIITLFCLTISAAVVNAQNNQAAPPPPPPHAAAPPAPAPKPVDPDAGKFQFKEEIHTFKDVPEGPLAEYDFEFKNVGKKPIVITDAHGSCGCTVPTWPHEPILPKQTAKIHVAYTTNGRSGTIDKAVTINSDAVQQPMMLYIKGNVIPKPVESKPQTPPPPAPPAK